MFVCKCWNVAQIWCIVTDLSVKLYIFFSWILLVICRRVQVNVIVYFMSYAAVASLAASQWLVKQHLLQKTVLIIKLINCVLHDHNISLLKVQFSTKYSFVWVCISNLSCTLICWVLPASISSQLGNIILKPSSFVVYTPVACMQWIPVVDCVCFNFCFLYCILIIYAILLCVIDCHCCFMRCSARCA